jgi:hypothetical protein
MTLALDAGASFARAEADDPEHKAIVAVLEDEAGTVLVQRDAPLRR